MKAIIEDKEYEKKATMRQELRKWRRQLRKERRLLEDEKDLVKEESKKIEKEALLTEEGKVRVSEGLERPFLKETEVALREEYLAHHRESMADVERKLAKKETNLAKLEKSIFSKEFKIVMKEWKLAMKERDKLFEEARLTKEDIKETRELKHWLKSLKMKVQKYKKERKWRKEERVRRFKERGLEMILEEEEEEEEEEEQEEEEKKEEKEEEVEEKEEMEEEEEEEKVEDISRITEMAMERSPFISKKGILRKIKGRAVKKKDMGPEVMKPVSFPLVGEKEKYQETVKNLEDVLPWVTSSWEVTNSWAAVKDKLILSQFTDKFLKPGEAVALEDKAKGQKKREKESPLKFHWLKKLKVPSHVPQKEKLKSEANEKWFQLLQQIMLGQPIRVADLNLTDDSLELSEKDQQWLKVTLQKLQEQKQLSQNTYQRLCQLLAKALSESQREWLHLGALKAITSPQRGLPDIGPQLSQAERKKISIDSGRLKIFPSIKRQEAKPRLKTITESESGVSIPAIVPATPLATRVSTGSSTTMKGSDPMAPGNSTKRISMEFRGKGVAALSSMKDMPQSASAYVKKLPLIWQLKRNIQAWKKMISSPQRDLGKRSTESSAILPQDMLPWDTFVALYHVLVSLQKRCEQDHSSWEDQFIQLLDLYHLRHTRIHTLLNELLGEKQQVPLDILSKQALEVKDGVPGERLLYNIHCRAPRTPEDQSKFQMVLPLPGRNQVLFYQLAVHSMGSWS
ncbi:uncharacterized protein LOC141509477 [Macrotis lagotis]|uniref:uncharacterized protein LOC141509477 n=1 Tax=Macrotis lagotis TaxID=92651 RepID=UPI003D69D015